MTQADAIRRATHDVQTYRHDKQWRIGTDYGAYTILTDARYSSPRGAAPALRSLRVLHALELLGLTPREAIIAQHAAWRADCGDSVRATVAAAMRIHRSDSRGIVKYG